MKEFVRETLPGIPLGDPPSAVMHQQAKVESLLASDGSPDELPETNGAKVSASHHSEGAARWPGPSEIKRAVVTETIRLEFVPPPGQSGIPSFRLKIDVGEVCITEYYISLLVTSDLGFEPAGTMKFKLTHGEKVYPVIYAGCEFEFKTVGVRGISFLRDKQSESHD